MHLTRRTVLTALTSAALADAAGAQAPKKPIVIAHRGASGYRPEHTVLAYKLAIDQGCDFIEPDLVATKDGHLVVRHENEIGGTTDVAARPEFASRKTTKLIDGHSLEGWFTEDFTLAELKTLRARERLPQLRQESGRYDGQVQIMTFEEVADLAAAESRRVGRTIGVYPEMKHPTYFRKAGLALEPRLAAAVRAKDLNSRTAPIFVQCFEAGPLKTFGDLSQARRVFLVARSGGPADRRGATYAQLTTPEGLKEVASFAEGLGPEWPMILSPQADGSLGAPSSLVADAHAAGLAVHPWTVRAENAFLPRSLQRGESPAGHGDAAALCKALYAAGVDGVFSDFPDIAVSARA